MPTDYFERGKPLTREGLFQLVTDEVLKDGVVEEREKALLLVLADFLKLDAGLARTIARTSWEKLQAGRLGKKAPLDTVVLYAKVLFFIYSDGVLDPAEETMLGGLRKLLSIPAGVHDKLLSRLRRDAPGQPEGPPREAPSSETLTHTPGQAPPAGETLTHTPGQAPPADETLTRTPGQAPPADETLTRTPGEAPPASETLTHTPGLEPPASQPPRPEGSRLWTPGTLVGDLYEVRELAGQGGMGSVYRVYHRQWGLDLAVKVPLPARLEDATTRQRFLRESEAWVRLGLHPFVAQCFYVREVEGLLRIFIEWVGGGTLKDWMRTGQASRAAWEKLLDLALQIADGLSHAHSMGMVHRDVKPANCLLTRMGTLKLTDFGLVKAATDEAILTTSPGGLLLPDTAGPGLTVVGSGLGTPEYAAPEQWTGETVDVRADIYALGILLYELVCGRRPFDGGEAHREPAHVLVNRHIYEAPPDPRTLRPGLPDELRDLVLHMIEKAPARRPKSMAQVRTHLAALYETLAGVPYPRPAACAGRGLADSLNNQAVSLLDLGRPDDARKLWDEALAHDPYHPEATCNRNIHLWRSGQTPTDTRLIDALGEVRRSDPKNPFVGYLEGITLLELGDSAAALRALEAVEGAEAGSDHVRRAIETARATLPSCRGALRTLSGHNKEATAVAVSADGRTVVSGGAEGRPLLWSLETGRIVKALPRSPAPLRAVAVSPDGRLAVWEVAEHALVLFDLVERKPLRTLAGHTDLVRSVCFSRDGRWIVSGGHDRSVRMWDAGTGRCERTFDATAGFVTSVSLDASAGRILAASMVAGGTENENAIRLWDVESGGCAVVFEPAPFGAAAACLSPDGLTALSGHVDGARVVWDAAAGRALRRIVDFQGGVTCVAMTDDGLHGLCGSEDGTVRLFELATGRTLRTFEGHEDEVHAVCVSRDGLTALSASADRTVRVWGLSSPSFRAPAVLSRVTTSEEAFTARLEYEQRIDRARKALAEGKAPEALEHLREARMRPGFSRGSEALSLWKELYTRLPRISLLDVWQTRELACRGSGIQAVAVSPDGRTALCGHRDGSLRCFAPEGDPGGLERPIPGTAGIASLAFAPDGRAYVGRCDGTIQLFDPTTATFTRALNVDPPSLRAMSPARDGRFLLVAGTPCLIDAVAGHRLRTFKGHPGLVNAVCVSPDGRFAFSGGDNDPRVIQWDLLEDKVCRELKTGLGHVAALALSEDCSFIVCAGGTGGARPDPADVEARMIQKLTTRALTSDDRRKRVAMRGGKLEILALVLGCTFGSLDAPGGNLLSVCLSPGGEFVLTGGLDGTLTFWNLLQGRSTRVLQAHEAPVTAVDWSRDGRLVVSGASDGSLRIWALDWELDSKPKGIEDPRVARYLDVFLAGQVPQSGDLPPDRFPTEDQIATALGRTGSPRWTDADLACLLATLAHAGFGAVSEDQLRQALETRARAGKPAITGELAPFAGVRPASVSLEPSRELEELMDRLATADYHQAMEIARTLPQRSSDVPLLDEQVLVPRLAGHLKSGNAAARSVSALILGRWQRKELVGAIVEALRTYPYGTSPGTDVKPSLLCEALLRLGDPSAAPAVRAAFDKSVSMPTLENGMTFHEWATKMWPEYRQEVAKDVREIRTNLLPPGEYVGLTGVTSLHDSTSRRWGYVDVLRCAGVSFKSDRKHAETLEGLDPAVRTWKGYGTEMFPGYWNTSRYKDRVQPPALPGEADVFVGPLHTLGLSAEQVTRATSLKCQLYRVIAGA